MSNNSNITIAAKNITSIDLFSDEEIIFSEKPSLLLFIMQAIGLLIIGGIIYWAFIKFNMAEQLNLAKFRFYVNLSPWVAVGLVILGLFINRMVTSYKLTTRRIEVSVKFLYSYDQSISLNKINSAKLQSSILGRILNYGTIVIKSAATDFQIQFANISNPKKYLEIIEEHIE